MVGRKVLRESLSFPQNPRVGKWSLLPCHCCTLSRHGGQEIKAVSQKSEGIAVLGGSWEVIYGKGQ